MAKLRHVAMVVEDVEETARFYERSVPTTAEHASETWQISVD
jgi:hypothetical protein